MATDDEVVWRVRDADAEAVTLLADDLNVSPLIARLLVSRGVKDVEEARLFLSPDLSGLHDPFLLPDMEIAVERISRAIDNDETIFLHGDYDADGVTSCALAYRMLTALGANVAPFVPSRARGYDLQRYGVDAAREVGAKLIVTVDCGSCAIDAITYARAQGMEVIVTDHHRCGNELPPALAIVNPYKPDTTVPFQPLCGAGVAFKLGDALVSRRMPAHREMFRRRFADLAAIGTVADVTPLIGENRLLVYSGLLAMQGTDRTGLRAMLESMQMGNRKLDARSISHGLGPRLNAAGRMEDADLAFRLLVTRQTEDASELARELGLLHDRCRDLTARATTEALIDALSEENEHRRVLVLARPRWGKGIVGVVANRIVEQCRRPVIMLSLDEEENEYHGSARSYGGFPLLTALHGCADLLTRYGGHSQSAGVSLHPDNLDAFRDRIDTFAEDAGLEAGGEPPVLEADAEVSHGGQINFELMEQMERMAPWGNGNPEPVFITRNVLVLECRACGKDLNTFQTYLRLPGATRGIKGVWFQHGDWARKVEMGSTVDIAYTPKINEFNGRVNVELTLVDMKINEGTLAALGEEEAFAIR